MKCYRPKIETKTTRITEILKLGEVQPPKAEILNRKNALGQLAAFGSFVVHVVARDT